MQRYVQEKDISSILEMMEYVKEDFAGYQEEAFLEALKKAITSQKAIVDVRDQCVCGLLSFSRFEKELTFLAVRPEFRKLNIAKQLINRMCKQFEDGDVVSVITFQKQDKKGIGARACYHGCGFIDAEELIVFDYPCQKMILHINNRI